MRQNTDQHIARWEAGDAGCAQLIIGLKRALDGVAGGECLEVVAHSAGAPVDIPAWCRVTGQELVSENHPTYVIRKEGD